MIINDFVVFAAANYAYVGIVALLVILVIVFAILSAKNWHWSNIVFLSLTVIAGAFAANGMATVFDQRTKAMKEYNKQEKALAKAEDDLQQAKSGSLMAETYEPGTLRYVDEKLSQALIGRGRAWSGGTATWIDKEKGTFKYTFPPTPGEDAPTAIGLKEYRLYAFLETQPAGRQITYPSHFVGVFRVDAETGTDLTLEVVTYGRPGLPLDGKLKWTLFEKMPQDRRDVFRSAIIAEAEANADNPAFADYQTLTKMFTDDNTPLDISLYRKVLQKDYLNPELMGFKLGNDPANQRDNARYENLLDRYSFDGLSLAEIENWIQNEKGRIANSFVPQPREIFIKYKFSKDTNDTDNPPIKVDEKGKLQNDGYYTTSGRAIVPQIQNNGEVEFKKDDVVLVDSLTAAGYKRGSDDAAVVPPFNKTHAVEEIGQFYFRSVQNFPYEFSEIQLQLDRLVVDLQTVQESIKTQTEINAKVKLEYAEYARQLSDATFDNENLAKDAQAISSLMQEKQRQLDQAESQIAQLEQDIKATYTKLRQKMLELSKSAFASN